MLGCDEDDMTTYDMAKMYREGSSMIEIAEEYKMTKQAVWKRLHKRGVKIRTKKEAWINSYERGRCHKIGGPGGVG